MINFLTQNTVIIDAIANCKIDSTLISPFLKYAIAPIKEVMPTINKE